MNEEAEGCLPQTPGAITSQYGILATIPQRYLKRNLLLPPTCTLYPLPLQGWGWQIQLYHDDLELPIFLNHNSMSAKAI